jgi:hypothetical protein
MSGAIKAAIGVCVGVLTLAAVFSFYSQLTDARSHRERDGASLHRVTPDYVMSKCGSPASDEVRVLTADGSADRELRYKATTITFYKSKSDKKWSYIAAQDSDGKQVDSPRALPALLPCLDQK